MSTRRKPKKDLSSQISICTKNMYNSNNIEINNIEIDISDILKKKLKVFRVSPLYNFQNDKLKQYGFKLKEEINAKRNPNASAIQFCKFNLNAKLRLNDRCAKAIQVEVIDVLNKIIYLGYFISWVENKEMPNFISVPIFLVAAKSLEINKINSSICKIFDCDIQPVLFSFYQMITFLVQLLENSHENTNESQEYIALEYAIPGCEAKDNIEVTFILEDTRIVLAIIADNIKKQNEKTKYLEIVLEFYNRIINHIYNVYKMDLMFAKLKKIVFPNAFITSDGQLRVTTIEAGMTVLDNLQSFISLGAILNG